jgi:hypothetical protein
MAELTMHPPTTSSNPVGRCRVFNKDGAWWLRQWHTLLPGGECGIELTRFDSEEKAEEQAKALVNSGRYIRVGETVTC